MATMSRNHEDGAAAHGRAHAGAAGTGGRAIAVTAVAEPEQARDLLLRLPQHLVEIGRTSLFFFPHWDRSAAWEFSGD
jgi:hypothetical protein